MNIYGHVLYIIIYVYMFILIYIPMKNFFPDLFLFKNSLLIKVLFKDWRWKRMIEGKICANIKLLTIYFDLSRNYNWVTLLHRYRLEKNNQKKAHAIPTSLSILTYGYIIHQYQPVYSQKCFTTELSEHHSIYDCFIRVSVFTGPKCPARFLIFQDFYKRRDT